ncbi:MAG: flagellar biosynthetic protein FliR [Pelovirga sp.]
MELPVFTTTLVQGFLICLARVAAVFAVLPIFSSGQVPPQMRIGVTVMFALLTYPVIQQVLPVTALTVVDMAMIVSAEVIFGLLVGFLAQLIFMAAEFAGSVIGVQMGFAMANVFDPTTQRQVALLAQFHGIIAILLFLSLNVHHLFLEAIVSSFMLLPPGNINLAGGAIPMIVELSNHALILSIRLVAPVLVVLILVTLVLGFITRIVPQLNVLFISFPLKIGLSFIVMGLTIGVFASILQNEFSALSERFLRLFSLL